MKPGSLLLTIIVMFEIAVFTSCRMSDSRIDSIRDAVKHMHTYEDFKNAYALFEERDRIVTPENYEKFIDMISEMYAGEFEDDELHVIEDFLTSDVGRKWLRFGREYDPWMEFAKRIL